MDTKALVLLFLGMVTFKEAAGGRPTISSKEEAEYIVLETTGSLLPDPALVQKIEKDVALIRKQRPEVAKTVFQGRKYLGKLKINGYSNMYRRVDIEGKINNSKFGPIVSSDKDGVVIFKQHFNPNVLADEMEQLGISGYPLWIRPPDFGEIQYNKQDSTYVFREGLENCKPKCTANNYYTYKINSGKVILEGQHATDIPR